jgi:hypothetical protein
VLNIRHFLLAEVQHTVLDIFFWQRCSIVREAACQTLPSGRGKEYQTFTSKDEECQARLLAKVKQFLLTDVQNIRHCLSTGV